MCEHHQVQCAVGLHDTDGQSQHGTQMSGFEPSITSINKGHDCNGDVHTTQSGGMGSQNPMENTGVVLVVGWL